MTADGQQAWVMRMRTSGGDAVDVGVEQGLLLMGWSSAEGLLDCSDYWELRDIVSREYYADEATLHRAGAAAGQLWNFIVEMKRGDLVVVPHGGSFYVAQVEGDAAWEPGSEPGDTAHRRRAKWLNEAQPIPRSYARSALWSRMKAQRTLTGASDLVEEIQEALLRAGSGETAPSMGQSLRAALIETTRDQLRRGYMNERRFEELVRDLFEALGAINTRIVPRRHDIGADIEADFVLGHMVTFPVRIQVKYWQGDAGLDPVQQLLGALADESMADVEVGFVVTTARYDEAAREAVLDMANAAGKQIVPIDGDDLAQMIVDHGLDALLATAE